MATSSGSNPGNDEDIGNAASILKDQFSYLEENLHIDNTLASKLYGWKPSLLRSQEYKRIGALLDQGEDDKAFEKWYTFATGYSEELLKEFCKCLRKAGKDARPKLIRIADKIEAAMEKAGRSAGMEENKIIGGSTPTPSTNPPGPQPTTAWIAAYEEALEKQGSVSVEVTRCLFIGPPAVGKSSLKHLLIHNKSKAVKISTRVMESPDVVRVTSEQYAVEEGSSSWKLLDGKAMIQSVQKSALERKYQSVDDSITQEEHQSSESGVSDTQSTNIEKNRSISNTIDQLAITDTKPVMKNEKVSKLEEAFAGMFKEISLKDGITLNNASFIHLLDSGGQPCFLDILPLLLTVPCTYILVFNASQDLNQPLLVKYRADKDSEKILPSSQTGQDLIRRMMSSFHTMAAKHSKKMSQFQEHGAQSPQLRIHLIGTFKDVLQQSGRLEDQSKSVTDAIQSLSILPSFNRIIKDPQGRLFHLINNNLTDDPKCSSEELEYIGCLRSSLSQSGSALTLDVPLMWYLLQQVIHTAGEKLMRYTELRDFAMKYQLNNHPMVVSKQHFASFVELFTVLGFFVYFSFPATPDESKWVCTDATFFYSEVSKLLSIQFTKVCKSETIHFKKTGSISLSPSFVLEELQISKAMDPEWLFKALVHTGIAADSDGKCQELFIPAALPSQDHPPYTTSLSVVCASFKFQKGVFLLEYINLPQGLYCRVIVELANFKKGLWKLVPEESTRTSVKFLWRNGQILLMESEDRLEIAVTFYEPFLSPKCTPCKVMDKVHNYCSGVLADVEMSMKKVADDMFGKQNPDIGDVVVGFRCPCDDKMPHLAIAVKDKNPSMRCIGGKMKGQYQKLSLDQMIWFAPLLQNQAKLTLQLHSGDLKFYKLCCESEPSPFQSGMLLQVYSQPFFMYPKPSQVVL
jgi:GTPase SAR1 family protein